MQSASAAQTWLCPLCHTFAARNFKGVSRHIGSVHSHEANFHVTCGLGGCPRSYKNYHSYKKHLYKQHRDILEVDDYVPNDSSSLSIQPAESIFEPPYNEVEDDVGLCDSSQRKKKESALFLMKSLTVSKISNTALDNLIGDISIIVDSQLQVVQDKLRTALLSKGLEFDDELTSLFQNCTPPFEGLQSVFLREEFYKENMNYLVS